MAHAPNIPPVQVHLCVKGGDAAIAFYESAFGAVCTMNAKADDGVRVLHANLDVFGTEIMLHDEFPEFGGDVMAPTSRGGAGLTINVNRPSAGDVDSSHDRAVIAGAASVLAPMDAFWGSRYAKVRDPFGHVWAFNAGLGT
jgi:PhnB protein